jgi:hypothetical protein
MSRYVERIADGELVVSDIYFAGIAGSGSSMLPPAEY